MEKTMNQNAARYALVRPVPSSYEHCVRSNTEKICVELAMRQHNEYCKALQRLGLKLIWIERDDSLPDSCFVEDTALVLAEKAIICNMNLASRAPEVAGVAKVLRKLKPIYHIKPPATIDGGDILRAKDKVFVGLSTRTNMDAANQLKQILKDTNLQIIPAKVHNVLHLKSACTYLGGDHVILSEGNFDTSILSSLTKIRVPKGDEYAADCLTVNGTVLMSKGYPRTRRLIETEGLRTKELDVSEFKKGDGALTCLSIVW
jgi:dimethylargininase